MCSPNGTKCKKLHGTKVYVPSMELYIRFSSLIEIDRSLYGTCVMPSVRKVLMAGLFKTIGTEKKHKKIKYF